MVTTTPAAAPKPGIRKLNLGGIATKKETGKTEYPQLPDDKEGTVAMLVASIRDKAARFKALESSLEIDKAELITIGKQYYFANGHGKSEVPSSIACLDKAGNEVLVSFTNRYKAVTDEPGLTALIGDDTAAQFRQKFTLKIDGDLVPEDKADTMLTELQELFAKYGCPEALTATSAVMPVKAFHAYRHTAYTPEVNLAIDRISPIVASVKTEGRKKS